MTVLQAATATTATAVRRGWRAKVATIPAIQFVMVQLSVARLTSTSQTGRAGPAPLRAASSSASRMLSKPAGPGPGTANQNSAEALSPASTVNSTLSIRLQRPQRKTA